MTDNLNGEASLAVVPAEALRAIPVNSKATFIKASGAAAETEKVITVEVGEGEVLQLSGEFSDNGKIKAAFTPAVNDGKTNESVFGADTLQFEAEPGTYTLTITVLTDNLNGNVSLSAVTKE